MIRGRHVRLAARFLSRRFRTLHPAEIQAVLTSACNLRCTYCRCPELRRPPLSTEAWRAVIARLGALGTLRIKFQGGEPTLREDFDTLCRSARAAGILTAVVTNGTLIADRPELLDHLDEVVVSIDAATPAVHDRVRGEGVHARAVRAAETARARGIPTYVNMVVHRGNLAELEPLLLFCERRGLRLNAQPVMFNVEFYDPGARPLGLTPGEIRALNRRLADWGRAGRAVMFSARTYAAAAGWPDYEAPTALGPLPSRCMAGRFYVHVEPDGDVHPCGQFEDASFVPKNIARDGLDAALLNARRHRCAACCSAYLIERKALFALRPAALAALARRG